MLTQTPDVGFLLLWAHTCLLHRRPWEVTRGLSICPYAEGMSSLASSVCLALFVRAEVRRLSARPRGWYSRSGLLEACGGRREHSTWPRGEAWREGATSLGCGKAHSWVPAAQLGARGQEEGSPLNAVPLAVSRSCREGNRVWSGPSFCLDRGVLLGRVKNLPSEARWPADRGQTHF